MPKLCETIAILKGVKSRVYSYQTQQDKLCQKPALFNGQTKTYEPLNEEDQDRPDGDIALVQQRTDDMIAEISRQLAELFDRTASLEYGNTHAIADVEVDGNVLLKGAPATYLLFLEKQLTDLHTAIGRMPVLSPEFTWAADESRNCWVSDTVKKVRTKKTPKVVMTATAKTTAKDGSVTEQQTGQVVTEDLPVGYWHTTYFSTALPATRRKELCNRVLKLQDAVKQARERANSTVVENESVGQPLLDWVFAD